MCIEYGPEGGRGRHERHHTVMCTQNNHAITSICDNRHETIASLIAATIMTVSPRRRPPPPPPPPPPPWYSV